MKKLLIILSSSSLVLMTLNFVLLLYFSNYTNIGLLATIISGWVSGLATLVVGIIAALQSKKYNDSNNEFIKKQYELEQSKSIVQSRLLFVNNLKKGWDNFSSNCNPLIFAADIGVISALDKTDYTFMYSKISEHALKLHKHYSVLSNLIFLDYQKSQEKEEAKRCLEEYNAFFSKMFEQKDVVGEYFESTEKLYKLIMDDLMKKYFAVNLAFNKYILRCDMDINVSISSKMDDVAYLKEQYSPTKGDTHGK